MTAWLTVAGFLLGGGFLTFVQFMINRHDQKHDKSKDIVERIEELSAKVDKVEASLDERDAVLARTHILRFQDELYNNMKHSKEYFEQTLDDIQTYNTFCDDNPRFANGRTKQAAKYIQEEYDRLFKEHKL